MSSVQASEAFRKFHRRLRALVEQQHEAGKVRALPLSPMQLARQAEGSVIRLNEQLGAMRVPSPQFSALVIDLFQPESPENLPEAEFDLEAAEAAWDAHFDYLSGELAELLKRSGYYHAVLSGQDDVDRFYSAIRERIPEKDRRVTKLYLLDGCKFVRNQFEVAGIPIARMSAAELEELGPSAMVCADFYPNESIDSKRFSKQWFLKVQEDVWTAYGEGSFVELRERPAEEIAAGYMAVAKGAPPALPNYLDAVLLLSLYKREFFEITKILICEAGWRRIWLRSGEARVPRRIAPTYSVDAAAWSTFESYLKLANAGLQNAKVSQDARPFIISSRRYLQATFATGDVFPQWETKGLTIEHPRSYELVDAQREDRRDVLEDAVLHYVFALEALLTGDTREAIAEKLAVSAALLIGRSDAEAVAVRSLVKKAYECRSALVHGRELKALDLNRLRRVCQRVLAVVLSLYAERQAIDLTGLLRELPLSHERQRQVGAARERILALLEDDSFLLED